MDDVPDDKFAGHLLFYFQSIIEGMIYEACSGNTGLVVPAFHR